MNGVLNDLSESDRRKEFLADLAQDFAVLRLDKKAWEEEKTERLIWEATLTDSIQEPPLPGE